MSDPELDRLVHLALDGDLDSAPALIRSAERHGDLGALALGRLLGDPSEATWSTAAATLSSIESGQAIARAVRWCRRALARWPADVRRDAPIAWLGSAFADAAHPHGRALLATANGLVVERQPIVGERLAALLGASAALAEPRTLELTACEVTDAVLEALLGMGIPIRALRLQRNRVTAPGLALLVERAEALGLVELGLGENPLRTGTIEALQRASAVREVVLPLQRPAEWEAIATAPALRDVERLVLERPLPRAPDGVEVWRAVDQDPLLNALLVGRAGVVDQATRDRLRDAAIDVSRELDTPESRLAIHTAAGRESAIEVRSGALGLRPRTALALRVTTGPMTELERVFLGESEHHRRTVAGALEASGGGLGWSIPVPAGDWEIWLSAIHRENAPAGLVVPDLVVQLLPSQSTAR